MGRPAAASASRWRASRSAIIDRNRRTNAGSAPSIRGHLRRAWCVAPDSSIQAGAERFGELTRRADQHGTRQRPIRARSPSQAPGRGRVHRHHAKDIDGTTALGQRRLDLGGTIGPLTKEHDRGGGPAVGEHLQEPFEVRDPRRVRSDHDNHQVGGTDQRQRGRRRIQTPAVDEHISADLSKRGRQLLPERSKRCRMLGHEHAEQHRQRPGDDLRVPPQLGRAQTAACGGPEREQTGRGRLAEPVREITTNRIALGDQDAAWPDGRQRQGGRGHAGRSLGAGDGNDAHDAAMTISASWPVALARYNLPASTSGTMSETLVVSPSARPVTLSTFARLTSTPLPPSSVGGSLLAPAGAGARTTWTESPGASCSGTWPALTARPTIPSPGCNSDTGVSIRRSSSVPGTRFTVATCPTTWLRADAGSGRMRGSTDSDRATRSASPIAWPTATGRATASTWLCCVPRR